MYETACLRLALHACGASESNDADERRAEGRVKRDRAGLAASTAPAPARAHVHSQTGWRRRRHTARVRGIRDEGT